MRMRTQIVAVFFLAAVLIAAAFLGKPLLSQTVTSDVQTLYADTQLLETVNSLQLTEQQLTTLLGLADNLARQRASLQALGETAETRQLLGQIRDALIQGKSQAEVDRLWQQLDQAQAKQADQQRAYAQAQDQAVAQALGLLSGKQVAALVEPVRDQAFVAVLEAARQVREVPDADFPQWLESASQQLGAQLALGNRAAAPTAVQKLRNEFQMIHGLQDADFQARLEKIAGDLQSIALEAGANPDEQWLKDTAGGMLAQFLGNDRTPVVLRAKLEWMRGR